MFFLRYVFIYFEIGKWIDKKVTSYIPKNERTKKNVLRIHNSEYFDGLDKSYSTVLLTVFFTLILFWGVLQSFIHIENKGKNISAQVMKTVTVLPMIKSNTQKLFLIKCGSSLCAVIDDNKNVSLVEPKNIIVLGSNFEKKKAP